MLFLKDCILRGRGITNLKESYQKYLTFLHFVILFSFRYLTFNYHFLMKITAFKFKLNIIALL